MIQKDRKAFTLVELLVVIAIIGILIGMLLPAVQSVREAARRTQCANKQRQLGLAVLNYESAHQLFPVNQVGAGESDGMGGFGPGYYSWLVPLLPFVEQNNLYSMFNLKINNGDGDGFRMSDTHPNAVAASTSVDLFLCPSGIGSGSDNSLVLGSASPASSNYVANSGWPSYATGFDGERAVPGQFNGVIPFEHPSRDIPWHGNSRSTFSQISDGSSNTALISERLIQIGNTIDEIDNYDPRLLSRHARERTETLAWINDEVLRSHRDVFQSVFTGRSWSSGYALTAPAYEHVTGPNSFLGHFNTSETEGDVIASAGSRHPGGVNVVYVDGSTHFISDGVNLEVWWALGARNDGRVVDLNN